MMVLFSRALPKTKNSTEKADSPTRMVTFTKENGRKERLTGEESLYKSQTDRCMMESGTKTKCMERAQRHGKKAE
jgi:hypothetical protein